jgi:hypothetical protein
MYRLRWHSGDRKIEKEEYDHFFETSIDFCEIKTYTLKNENGTLFTHQNITMDSNGIIRVKTDETMNETFYMIASTAANRESPRLKMEILILNVVFDASQLTQRSINFKP